MAHSAYAIWMAAKHCGDSTWGHISQFYSRAQQSSSVSPEENTTNIAGSNGSMWHLMLYCHLRDANEWMTA